MPRPDKVVIVAPLVVCEMSKTPFASMLDEVTIEPDPDSASVAPESIVVAPVYVGAGQGLRPSGDSHGAADVAAERDMLDAAVVDAAGECRRTGGDGQRCAPSRPRRRRTTS